MTVSSEKILPPRMVIIRPPALLSGSGPASPQSYLSRCLTVLILLHLLRSTDPSLLSLAFSGRKAHYCAPAGVAGVASFLVVGNSPSRLATVAASSQRPAPRVCRPYIVVKAFSTWLWREASRGGNVSYAHVSYIHPPRKALPGFSRQKPAISSAGSSAFALRSKLRQPTIDSRQADLSSIRPVKYRRVKPWSGPLHALLGKEDKAETVVSVHKANKVDDDLTKSATETGAEVFSIILNHQRKLRFREGQSVGIIPRLPVTPPAGDRLALQSQSTVATGRENNPRSTRAKLHPRLYSIASSHQGDDGSGSTFTLCVKKHVYQNPITGRREPAKDGLCSNYICNVDPGDIVAVTGPVGKTLLLPAQSSSPLVMLGTGTGVAPFRGHIAYLRAERDHRDAQPRDVFIFLGAQSAASLPYLEDWQALKAEGSEYGTDVHFAWSRPVDSDRKTYVQDLVWDQREKVWEALVNKKGHLYLCGLKGMLTGVTAVLSQMAAEKQLAEKYLIRQLKVERRWHAEVY